MALFKDFLAPFVLLFAIYPNMSDLINLGSPKDQAIGVGLSSKGYWRLARTFASQCGLTNTYLKEQGLLLIKDLWCAYHYLGTR